MDEGSMETKVCVIGGKLQGTEALYLAEKAGMETTLIDHSNSPLGKNFCGRFLCRDVIQYNRELLEVLEEADFVIPALEDRETLTFLAELAREHDINLVYDEAAYEITSSKLKSDRLMREKGLPCPRYYPEGNFPYIVKPSALSCSAGVARIDAEDAMRAFLDEPRAEEWVVEEYLDGPSYSLEVIGVPGAYRTYHVTELFMDRDYDCKRVLSRPDLEASLRLRLEEETFAPAEAVRLHGIMDVEVIESGGDLKILEIDARIPSQTPIAVYHATGVNMMSELAEIFAGGNPAAPRSCARERFVALEHIRVEGNRARVLGEHILSEAEPLTVEKDFCGADEALTDYAPGKENWTATLISAAESREELARKRARIPEEIAALIRQDVVFGDEEPER